MAIATQVRRVTQSYTCCTDFAAPRSRAIRSRLRCPIPLRSRSTPVPGIERDIRVQFAATRDEWEQAFQLVARQYKARGYEEADAECRFTGYHALPETVVLVAKAADRVVATLSLVMDNTLLGLPLESLYRSEVQALRQQGRRLCEVGNLADTGLSTREFVAVFVALIQLSWQHHVRHGGDTGIIAVNPRHSAFYTKMLGFLPMGPRRAYDKVQGHPAEAFYLDPALMAARVPNMHQRMFGTPLPAEVLAAPRLPEHLVHHFAARSNQTCPAAVAHIMETTKAGGSPRRWH